MSVVRTLIGNVKGPKGDTGATGATGAQGDAATIQVGTVTTGAYGTNASVTNSGTEQDAVFDFVIPQGKPGEEVTDASNLTLNEITASSANYPTFTVQERLKGIFGKIQKFLSDLKSNYVSKSMMTTSTNIDTGGQAVADAKAIKTLNDALASFSIRSVTQAYDIVASGSMHANLKTLIDADMPSGYKCLGVVGFTTNHIGVYLNAVGYRASEYSLQAYNNTNGQRTGNIQIWYLCYKS